jgi:hypothetical protein
MCVECTLRSIDRFFKEAWRIQPKGLNLTEVPENLRLIGSPQAHYQKEISDERT